MLLTTHPLLVLWLWKSRAIMGSLYLYLLMYIFLLDVSVYYVSVECYPVNRQIMEMQQVLKLLCSLPKEVHLVSYLHVMF